MPWQGGSSSWERRGWGWQGGWQSGPSHGWWSEPDSSVHGVHGVPVPQARHVHGVHGVPVARRPVKPDPGWNSEGPINDGFGAWQWFVDPQVRAADFNLPAGLRRNYSGSLCGLLRYKTAHPHVLSLADCVRALPHNAPEQPNLAPPVNEETIWELLVNNRRYELARRWTPGEGATATSAWWVRSFNRKCRRCLNEAELPDPPSGVAWQSYR